MFFMALFPDGKIRFCSPDGSLTRDGEGAIDTPRGHINLCAFLEHFAVDRVHGTGWGHADGVQGKLCPTLQRASEHCAPLVAVAAATGVVQLIPFADAVKQTFLWSKCRDGSEANDILREETIRYTPDFLAFAEKYGLSIYVASATVGRHVAVPADAVPLDVASSAGLLRADGGGCVFGRTTHALPAIHTLRNGAVLVKTCHFCVRTSAAQIVMWQQLDIATRAHVVGVGTPLGRLLASIVTAGIEDAKVATALYDTVASTHPTEFSRVHALLEETPGIVSEAVRARLPPRVAALVLSVMRCKSHPLDRDAVFLEALVTVQSVTTALAWVEEGDPDVWVGTADGAARLTLRDALARVRQTTVPVQDSGLHDLRVKIMELSWRIKGGACARARARAGHARVLRAAASNACMSLPGTRRRWLSCFALPCRSQRRSRCRPRLSGCDQRSRAPARRPGAFGGASGAPRRNPAGARGAPQGRCVRACACLGAGV